MGDSNVLSVSICNRIRTHKERHCRRIIIVCEVNPKEINYFLWRAFRLLSVIVCPVYFVLFMCACYIYTRVGFSFAEPKLNVAA